MDMPETCSDYGGSELLRRAITTAWGRDSKGFQRENEEERKGYKMEGSRHSTG